MKLVKTIVKKIQQFVVKRVLDQMSIKSVNQFQSVTADACALELESVMNARYLMASAARYMTDPAYRKKIDAQTKPVYPKEAFVRHWGQLNRNAGSPVIVEGNSALTMGEWFTLIYNVQKYAATSLLMSEDQAQHLTPDREFVKKGDVSRVEQHGVDTEMSSGITLMAMTACTPLMLWAFTHGTQIPPQTGYDMLMHAFLWFLTLLDVWALTYASIPFYVKLFELNWTKWLGTDLPATWHETLAENSIPASLVRQNILMLAKFAPDTKTEVSTRILRTIPSEVLHGQFVCHKKLLQPDCWQVSPIKVMQVEGTFDTYFKNMPSATSAGTESTRTELVKMPLHCNDTEYQD